MGWALDPHHTSVSFSAKHLGVATVRGRFAKVDAEVDLDDPDDPPAALGTTVPSIGPMAGGPPHTVYP